MNQTFQGTFTIEHYRGNRLIGTYCQHNAITLEGQSTLLNRIFNNVPIIPNWYIGLINQNDYVGLDVSDTLASHPGWRESDAYTTRSEWIHDATAAYAILDTPHKIPITALVETTIRGVFIASTASPSDLSGVLWATVDLPNLLLYVGDRLLVGYRLDLLTIPLSGAYDSTNQFAIDGIVIDQGPY